MTMSYSTALKNRQLDAITTEVGSAGKLRIYTSPKPAFGAAITTQTLLADFTLGSPFAPNASTTGNVLSPTLPSAVTASNPGTALWYRVQTSGGTAVIDGDCSTSSGDMQLNTTTIGSGVQVSVTAWTITNGN